MKNFCKTIDLELATRIKIYMGVFVSNILRYSDWKRLATASFFLLVLTACGGAEQTKFTVEGSQPFSAPAPTNTMLIPSEESIKMFWTNPKISNKTININYFIIDWEAERGTLVNNGQNMKDDQTDSGMRASHSIMDLKKDTVYDVGLQVMYSQDTDATIRLRTRTGANRDQDPYIDELDNCPDVYDVNQLDTDRDGIGDVCDNDADGDSVLDAEDNCPLIANQDQSDFNENDVGDVCEDMDGDSVLDAKDNCPLIANQDQADFNENAVGDACEDTDGDSVLDAKDNCPLIANQDQSDFNDNAVGDACEDTDGDSVKDGEDNCPLIANQDQSDFNENAVGDACEDTDGDSVKDGEDNCPLIANQDQADFNNNNVGDACEDTDGDSVKDGEDNCPLIANQDQADFNDNAVGDACEDTDGDSVKDGEDNCPLIANQDQSDFNDNAVGDACDDTDGDSVKDGEDNCPTAPNQDQSDFNDNAVGDACEDTDGDSVKDGEDNCPLIANQDQSDFNDNAVGDACEDTDGDSVKDGEDNCPLIANQDQSDFNDNDVGDACDDMDGDSVLDINDNCPLIANQDQTDFNENAVGDACDDTDGDSVMDMLDRDQDNDALIDIRSLEDLASMGADLDGDGINDNISSDKSGPPQETGCPLAGCIGYELTRSLDFRNMSSYREPLENYANWMNGGWAPIGSCSAFNTCQPYIGVFDGDGYEIANLRVQTETNIYGLGLFGALDGEIKDVRLTNVSIRGGAGDIGSLVGYGEKAKIKDVSVAGADIGDLMAGAVGGLIGRGKNVEIRDSSITKGFLQGGNAVGGLLGKDTNNSLLLSSYFIDGNVRGDTDLGGLIGSGVETGIRFSFVADTGVVANSNETNFGGLIGSAAGLDITASYAANVDVLALNQEDSIQAVGGLVGRLSDSSLNGKSYGVRILASYARGGSVIGNIYVGGLVGQQDDVAVNINHSYAAGPVMGDDAQAGGLTGDIAATIASSYWDLDITGQKDSAPNATAPGAIGLSQIELQEQTSFDAIYEEWDDLWCEPATGAFATQYNETSWITDEYRVWDLGLADQYPALTCVPGGVLSQGQNR